MTEPVSTKSAAEIAKFDAEAAKARAETTKTVISLVVEAVKGMGIVVSLVLAGWANCTKADASKVEAAVQDKGRALDVLSENVEKQHDQTERLREVVEGTTEAVKTIASSPIPAGIPVLDKEPKERGCWTVYGGIVRCKGLSDPKDATTAPPRPIVQVPKPPPPAPPPKSLPPERRQSF